MIAAVGFPLFTSRMNFLSSCLQQSPAFNKVDWNYKLLKYWLLWLGPLLHFVSIFEYIGTSVFLSFISWSPNVGNILHTPCTNKASIPRHCSPKTETATFSRKRTYLHSLTRLDISSVTWILLPWMQIKIQNISPNAGFTFNIPAFLKTSSLSLNSSKQTKTGLKIWISAIEQKPANKIQSFFNKK